MTVPTAIAVIGWFATIACVVGLSVVIGTALSLALRGLWTNYIWVYCILIWPPMQRRYIRRQGKPDQRGARIIMRRFPTLKRTHPILWRWFEEHA